MTDETLDPVKNETTHDQIVSLYHSYLEENVKFEDKDVKAAASRARKALGALGKLTKVRRAEIQERKLALGGKIETNV